MERFVYAIPSYKRAQKQVTLDYLSGMGVPKDRIMIFVQTEKDFHEYQNHKDRATIVLMEANGIARARNNILNRLKDSNLLMMDDDVKTLYILKDGELKEITNRIDLALAINRCFAQARSLGSKIFGIYPVANAFFMSDDISTRVTVNTVMGYASGFPFRFDETFETKEDAELCGRVLKRGGRVVRFNNLAVKADHNKDTKGYKDKEHQGENLRMVKKLCARYPDIFSPQKGKPWEVRVKIRDSKAPNAAFKNTQSAQA